MFGEEHMTERTNHFPSLNMSKHTTTLEREAYFLFCYHYIIVHRIRLCINVQRRGDDGYGVKCHEEYTRITFSFNELSFNEIEAFHCVLS